MTKERFILCNKTTDSNVWDTLKKQCYSWEYVVYLLNELDNECGLLAKYAKLHHELYEEIELSEWLKKELEE